MKKEKNEMQIPICVLFLRGILFVFFTLCLGLILEKKKKENIWVPRLEHENEADWFYVI